HDGGDDPERLGDLHDAPIFVARDHTDGLHRLDELIDLLRAEEIFLNLVFNDAVAGFVDRERRERPGPRRGPGRPPRSRAANLWRADRGELEPRALGARRELARFGHRREIAI